MGHHAEHSSLMRGHRGDILHGTVRIRRQVLIRAYLALRIGCRNPMAALERGKYLSISIIFSLAVRNGKRERMDAFRPRAFAGNFEVNPPVKIARGIIRQKRAGQNAEVRENLETVADAYHKAVARDEFLQFLLQMILELVGIRLSRTRIVSVGKSSGNRENLVPAQYLLRAYQVVDMYDV